MFLINEKLGIPMELMIDYNKKYSKAKKNWGQSEE
jgi:hypothetical protein